MATAPPSERASAYHRRALDRATAGHGTSPDADASADPVAGNGAGRPSRAPAGAAVLGLVLVGLTLGLVATALTVRRGWDPGAVWVGPWVARPRIGTRAIDPYARAALARTGAVPLAANEGLTFTAIADDTGYRLVPNCRYAIGGTVPAARFWTLTVTDAAGHAMGGPARRTAFTSATVVRDMTGRFSIEASPLARPGNWLPLTGDLPLTLTLRLYDTPLAGNPADVAAATLPPVTRLACSAPEAATVPEAGAVPGNGKRP